MENPAGFTCICTSSWTGASCTDGDSDQWRFHSLILWRSIIHRHTPCARGSSSYWEMWPEGKKKVVLVWDKSNLRSYLCSKRDPSSHINRMHTCVYNRIYTRLLLAFLCITCGDDFIQLRSRLKKGQAKTFKVYMSSSCLLNCLPECDGRSDVFLAPTQATVSGTANELMPFVCTRACVWGYR